MKTVRAIFLGVVIGVSLTALATAGAAWLVQGEGEVSTRLASLEPLKLGKVTVVSDDLAFPGRTVRLAGDVENPNPPVTILGSDLRSLASNDPGCDLSDVKYLDVNKIDVPSGTSEDVVLGRLQLPDRLGNDCQGDSLEAVLVVRAAFGTTD